MECPAVWRCGCPRAGCTPQMLLPRHKNKGAYRGCRFRRGGVGGCRVGGRGCWWRRRSLRGRCRGPWRWAWRCLGAHLALTALAAIVNAGGLALLVARTKLHVVARLYTTPLAAAAKVLAGCSLAGLVLVSSFPDAREPQVELAAVRLSLILPLGVPSDADARFDHGAAVPAVLH